MGGRGRLGPTLHCHHLNDFILKMDNDEGHFDVSLIVRGKVPAVGDPCKDILHSRLERQNL